MEASHMAASLVKSAQSSRGANGGTDGPDNPLLPRGVRSTADTPTDAESGGMVGADGSDGAAPTAIADADDGGSSGGGGGCCPHCCRPRTGERSSGGGSWPRLRLSIVSISRPVVWLSAACLVTGLTCIVMASYAVRRYEEAAGELRTARENRGKVCLPCDVTATVVESWKSERGGECCVHLEDLLGIMRTVASNEVEQRLNKDPNRMRGANSGTSGGNGSAPLWPARASAHLVGSAQQSWATSGGPSDMDGAMIEWDVGQRLSHVTWPLEYRQGKLIIPASGYYFVYSQVNTAMVFDEPDASRHERRQPLSHSLWRRRRSGRYGDASASITSSGHEALARSRQSTCWSPKLDYEMTANYLGAVFYLDKDDEIYVKVSNVSLLYGDRLTSFFGIVVI